LYVNANEMAWILQMLEVSQKAVAKENYRQAGERLYKLNCMSCHGANRQGGGNYPSIVNAKANTTRTSLSSHQCRQAYDAFLPYLGEADKEAIRSYVLDYKPTSKSRMYIRLRLTTSFVLCLIVFGLQ
jgi:quinoprotein glucose dehydrogenase